MPNPPDTQAAREAAEQVIAEFEELDEQFHRAYGPGDDKPDLCELRKRLFSKAYQVAQVVLDDPTSLLKQPEWGLHHGAFSWHEMRWQTINGIYQVVGRKGKYVWARVGVGEPIDCESLEAGQLACWLHYVAAMREAFQ